MKAILALLFLAAISVFVQAEWASEFHPQAMLEYVRGEDHEMKRQLYHLDQGPFLGLNPIKREQLKVLCCDTPCVNSWPF